MLSLFLACLAVLPAHAQFAPLRNAPQFYRNGASLDMDFIGGHYMVSVTSPVVYTSLTAFLADSNVSGTFSRATSNITASGVSYLVSGQSFVSRANSNIVASSAPFYQPTSANFVSRASGGTYFDSTGTLQTAATNTARADYNPSTLAAKGLLLEPAATNLLPRSGQASLQFNPIAATTSDSAITAPDGTLTGSIVSETATTADHYLEKISINTASNQVLTFSAFLKPIGSRNDFEVIVYGNNHNDKILARCQTGTNNVTAYATGTGQVTAYSLTPLPNGWYRCSVSGQPTTSAVTDTTPRIQIVNSSTTYLGDPTQGVAVWGTQLEQNASPTSYIATSGTTVTRAADVYSGSPATYFDSTGTLQIAPANTARTDYNPTTLAANGLLVEGASTNSISNSTMQGAVPGYPGTWPNNTSHQVTTSGLSSRLVATGTESGMNYVDIQVSGTNTSASTTYVGFYSTAGQIAASPSQTWVSSFYSRVVSGSQPVNGISGLLANFIFEYNVSGTAFGFPSSICPAASSTISRCSAITTMPTGTSSIIQVIEEAWPANATGDITYRIYGTQLELGTSPTSFIPTVSAATTRAADIYTQNVATYFDNTGTLQVAPFSTPRFDYDPVTHAAKGLLVEEVRTNLITSSDNAAASSRVAVSVSPDVVTAPNGNTSMDRIYANVSTTSSEHYADWQIASTSIVLDTSYTYSLYAKPAENNWISLRSVYGNGVSDTPVYFNVSTSAISALGSWPTNMYVSSTAFIQDVGNGVKRVGYVLRTPTVGPATNSFLARKQLATGVNATVYVGDGNGVYVWGEQFEQGAFPTSYIPTAGGAATRQPDNFTIPTGGWYTAGQGTLLANGMLPWLDANTSHRYAELNNGSSNSIATLTTSGLANKVAILNAGSTVYSQSPNNLLANVINKGALAYSSSSGYSSYNGAAYGAGSGGTLPTFTQLSIGSGAGSFYLDGWAARTIYMPGAQPNASMPDYTR